MRYKESYTFYLHWRTHFPAIVTLALLLFLQSPRILYRYPKQFDSAGEIQIWKHVCFWEQFKPLHYIYWVFNNFLVRYTNFDCRSDSVRRTKNSVCRSGSVWQTKICLLQWLSETNNTKKRISFLHVTKKIRKKAKN